MQFPKDKMKLSSSYHNKESENGWLVLDIKNVDLDGVSQLYISMDEVEQIKTRSSQDKNTLENLRNLLSE